MDYEKIKYPDGQISVKLKELSWPYKIRERINSYEDLIVIKSIVEALDYHNIKNRHLEIPCLFGQRSDRRFSEKQSFDLKIIAELINSCGFMDVRIFDPHSDVSLALINNSTKISPLDYIRLALNDEEELTKEKCILISPDAGSYKKCFEIGEKVNREIVAAVKHRSSTGELDMKFIGDVKDKNCIIIDDLADGGYTFELLGGLLKHLGAKRVSLYVSHAYFTKGFGSLSKVIDHIYCTNSVKDIEESIVTQYKII